MCPHVNPQIPPPAPSRALLLSDIAAMSKSFFSSRSNSEADPDEGSLPSVGNLWLVFKALLRKTFVRDGTQDISLEPPHPR